MRKHGLTRKIGIEESLSGLFQKARESSIRPAPGIPNLTRGVQMSRNQYSTRTFVSLAILFSVVLLAPVRPIPAQDAPQSTGDEFRIGVSDVLTVSVWKNPDLSAQVPVRPDGKIALPLVGEVHAADMTPDELRQELNTQFASFVTAPTISVVVNEINSMKVFIVGEVRSPGSYDIIEPTRLMQALAMAGGLSEYADKSDILILRQQGSVENRIIVSVKGITNGKKMEDNILLEPGDTIVVP